MFSKTHFATTTAVAAALLLSACGSSGSTDSALDSQTAPVEGEEASSGQSEVAETDPAEEDNEVEETGGPTGSLTLGDGTVIELVVNACATKTTNPTFFLIDNGFDVSGNSADDFYHFGAIKAAAEGDPAPLIDLTGDRDENRVNPKIDYINNGGSDDVATTVAADGSRVHGEVVLRDFHSTNAVFGETVTATVDFNCV